MLCWIQHSVTFDTQLSWHIQSPTATPCARQAHLSACAAKQLLLHAVALKQVGAHHEQAAVPPHLWNDFKSSLDGLRKNAETNCQ